MEYIIGIDGGGTGSTCAIADITGRILFTCKGGPTNFLRFDIDEVTLTIFRLIEKCKEHLKIDFSEIVSVVVGTAGGGETENAAALEKNLEDLFKGKKILIRKIKVVSDALIALEGAFSGGPGSILISGTGSIIFGKNQKGVVFRFGGYGSKIGDEGGAYSIARKGMNAVSKDFDGRGEKTLITKLVIEKYGIDSGEKLINEIYINNFDIASAAPLVIEAAVQGDRTAIKILDEETDELIIHIKRMTELMNERRMKISFIGTLISNKNFYSDLLRSKVKSEVKNIEIVKPENSPEAGAVLLAIKLNHGDRRVCAENTEP